MTEPLYQRLPQVKSAKLSWKRKLGKNTYRLLGVYFTKEAAKMVVKSLDDMNAQIKPVSKGYAVYIKSK